MDILTLEEFKQVIEVCKNGNALYTHPFDKIYIPINDKIIFITPIDTTIQKKGVVNLINWKVVNKVRLKAEIVRSKKIIYEEVNYRTYNSPTLRWPT